MPSCQAALLITPEVDGAAPPPVAAEKDGKSLEGVLPGQQIRKKLTIGV